MNASELRKSLKDAGLDEETIERLVKAEVTAGKVDDDKSEIDPALIDTVTESVRKAMEAEVPVQVAAEVDADELAKAEGLGEVIDVTEALVNFAKGNDVAMGRLDTALEFFKSQHDTLAGAFLALGQLTQQLHKSNGELGGKVDQLQTELSAITKAMRLPVAPRAVTTDHEAVATPDGVPAPDAAIAKAQGGDVDARNAKRTELIAKAQAEIKTTEDAARQHELLRAVAELDAQIDPATVAQNYGLTL